MTLIAPDNHLAIMAALFVIAGLGFLGEKTKIGAQLTGAVITILAAIVAANVGLIPHSAPAYSFVFTYLVPPLIPLFLFQADLRKILFETTRTTGAFLLATAGTVAGVTLAVLLLFSADGVFQVLVSRSLSLFLAGFVGYRVWCLVFNDIFG